MASIMQENQSKYVPLSHDKSNVLATIPLHGDQLFEERSRNVKWTFQDGVSSVERLEAALSQLISISLFLEGEGGWELAEQ